MLLLTIGNVLFVAASWVVSPLLSGLTSSILYVLIQRFILSKVCLDYTIIGSSSQKAAK